MYILILLIVIILFLYFYKIKKENFNGYRVVTFYHRIGCPWCHEMMPIWEDIVKMKGQNITFRKIDTTNMTNPPNIVPTFTVATEKGMRVRSGAVNGATLLEWILQD